MAEPVGFGQKTIRAVTQVAKSAWSYLTAAEKRKKIKSLGPGDIKLGDTPTARAIAKHNKDLKSALKY